MEATSVRWPDWANGHDASETDAAPGVDIRVMAQPTAFIAVSRTFGGVAFPSGSYVGVSVRQHLTSPRYRPAIACLWCHHFIDGGLVRMLKRLLFLIGFVLMAQAAVHLRGSSLPRPVPDRAPTTSACRHRRPDRARFRPLQPFRTMRVPHPDPAPRRCHAGKACPG